VVAAGHALADTAPALPAALLHDVLWTPVRHARVLGGLVSDGMELATPHPPGAPARLFRHTLRALQETQTLAAASRLVGRVTDPANRTARLAIVLTARAVGVPAQDRHVDMLRRAIDREDPDLGPLLAGLVELLAETYGRDAVRVILN
jgi:hypothetical protein